MNYNIIFNEGNYIENEIDNNYEFDLLTNYLINDDNNNYDDNNDDNANNKENNSNSKTNLVKLIKASNVFVETMGIKFLPKYGNKLHGIANVNNEKLTDIYEKIIEKSFNNNIFDIKQFIINNPILFFMLTTFISPFIHAFNKDILLYLYSCLEN